VLNKVNNGWWRRARLWLAARLAPAGVKVHDPAAGLCDCWEGLLELVCFQWRRQRSPDGADAEGEVLALVNVMLDELVALGAATTDGCGGYKLTAWGEGELARMWGPDIAPPWSSPWRMCGDHGIFETFPGDPDRCPDCPQNTTVEGRRPWWMWKLDGRMSRYPL
jgi:hypothetical protein